MTEKQPVAEQPIIADDATPTPWTEARGRLEKGGTYWLATVRPDGRPHVVPVLAVWADGALHFVAGETSRKARNLASNSHCVVTVGSHALDLVVEGEVTKVHDGKTTLTTTVAHDSVEERDGVLQSGMQKGAAETQDRLAKLLQEIQKG